MKPISPNQTTIIMCPHCHNGWTEKVKHNRFFRLPCDCNVFALMEIVKKERLKITRSMPAYCYRPVGDKPETIGSLLHETSYFKHIHP